ncbi:MAG TPA: hypothetical protein VFB94_28535 [Acidimicrobiales bacterium]|nr:hypothetical protein [Acidimicrobiales bacterium]
MFAVHCHHHGCRVLLDYSRVRAIHNTPGGPVMDWECWCGARGRLSHGVSTPGPPLALAG